MKRLRNIHPGEVLLEEFLKPMNLPWACDRRAAAPHQRDRPRQAGNHCGHCDLAGAAFRHFGAVLDEPSG